MRVLILFAGASLALSACGKNQPAGNDREPAANDLSAEKIVANDVTAIDAVTADSANIAADVDYNLEENGLDNLDNLDNAANSLDSKTASKPAAKPSRKTPPPAGNDSGNAAN